MNDGGINIPEFGEPGDTIAAVASPPGNGAISVIRISGNESFAIVNKIFRAAGDRSGSNPEHGKMTLGNIISQETGHVVDQVMAVFFYEPASYTGENSVEIFCHGGRLVTKEVLSQALHAGARPALRGEFTQRAHLNGKMDLTQAEAVLDVINSKNKNFLGASINKLSGALGSPLKNIRSSLIELLASIEVAIDYPEDDAPQVPEGVIKDALRNAQLKLQQIISSCDSVRINNEGPRIAVAGRPNAGKSSTVNMILNDTRTIVSDTPGTTRDLVGDWTSLDGIDFYIMDTAGITNADNPVELEGIRRAKEYIENADVVIAVFDASQPWSEMDVRVAEILRSCKRVVPVINKTDLEQKISEKKVSDAVDGEILSISAKTGVGKAALMERISREIAAQDCVDENLFCLGERQKNLLNTALFAIEQGLESAGTMPDDVIASDIREAAEAIGKITGDSVTEELLNTIFQNFCVGK